MGGRYPPRAHNFGCDIVHHFPKVINIEELIELVAAGRLKAQAWCLEHGHEWKDTTVCGFDFHGQPVPYTFLAPSRCKLRYAPWVSGPYAELVETVVAEGKQARIQQHRVLACPGHLTRESLDHFAWSLATCYINERPLTEEFGSATTV